MIHYNGPTRWDFNCMVMFACLVLYLCTTRITNEIGKQRPKPSTQPAIFRPVVVLINQPPAKRPLLPTVAPLPDADIRPMIAELRRLGLSKKDADTMLRLSGGDK